jgi:glyoxylase-like metal-dependent hydrolase (beta-lactamase superfamily II)
MTKTTANALELFDLDQDLPGYGGFIACWAYRDQRVRLLVDPGPRSTAAGLCERLQRAGWEEIDLVLLTHIHLDHGGGAAEVLEAFPRARWCAHPKGVDHLLDPSRLWQGSLATIGPVAEAYGRPRSLPARRRIAIDELPVLGVEVVETPGHAAHHLSFVAGEVLFAGEAIATRLPLPDGRNYLRPATPPRFFPQVFADSLARLRRIEPEPAICAFAHHERALGVRCWCERAEAQLERWLALAERAAGREAPDLDRLVAELLDTDPDFGRGRFQALTPAVRERERFYVHNSLRGLLQAVAG